MRTPYERLRNIFITFLSLLILTMYPCIAYATDGWKATDSAWEYGLNLETYAGDDDPDNTQKTYFAPYSSFHDCWWYDYTNTSYADWVYDDYIAWNDSAMTWFANNNNYNLVWEIRSRPDEIYEGTGTFYTNLPSVNHNQDSSTSEEQSDGYEEWELGWYQPENFDPNTYYWIYTAWSLEPGYENSTLGQFEIEAELTKWSLLGAWWPVDWDQIGEMVWNTNNPPL
ncbi:MAG: hypothetical protein AB1510_00830 [Bacillota bacterium]